MTILALASVAVGQMIKPPTHRVWTAILSDSTEVRAVRNGVVYYTSQLAAGALDAQTGKSLWSQKLDGWNSKGTINRSSMFVISQGEKMNSLYSVNLKTGAPKKLVAFATSVDDIACDENRVYIQMATTVQAFDSVSGKPIWKKDYFNGKPHERTILGSISTGFGHLFVGLEKAGMFCLEPKTGTVIWKAAAEYAYDPPTFLPNGALTKFNGIQLFDYATGKPKWSITSEGTELLGTAGKVVLVKKNKKLLGIDATNGKQIWSTTAPIDTASRSGGNRDHLPTDDQGAMISDDGFFHVTAKGVVDWSIKPTFDGSPIFADNIQMICNDGNRLLGYASGPKSQLPSDESRRKTLALALVSNFETLDQAERDQIVALAKYTTQPLIRRYVAWSKSYDAKGESGDASGRDMLLYDLLTQTPRMLDEMCTRDDTSALIQAIADMGPKSQYQNEIKTVLGHKGDPSRVMPNYVASLIANRNNKRNRDDSAALDAIAHSSDPTAVNFLIESLKDPTAPSEWRHAAFSHLAGTGGEAGVEAVRQARAKSGARPTWQQSLTARMSKRDVITQGTDAKGRTWRLLHSGVLGNTSDLFMQEKSGTTWGDAIFLNVYTGATFGHKPPTEYKGIMLTKLIETEWLKVFPDDAALRTDSDGDGLTDLVEARLGTDPKKPDTDGDGLKDSVDPCPNAAPRTLNDTEKIIAACIEAKFFEQSWQAPAVINVEKVTPFELYGIDCFVMWGNRLEGKLGSMYGGGVNMIGFSGPIKDFKEDVRSKDMIEFSKDGKSAETMISRYSGGLNGEGEAVSLIKVGDDWFVTDIKMRYVS